MNISSHWNQIMTQISGLFLMTSHQEHVDFWRFDCFSHDVVSPPSVFLFWTHTSSLSLSLSQCLSVSLVPSVHSVHQSNRNELTQPPVPWGIMGKLTALCSLLTSGVHSREHGHQAITHTHTHTYWTHENTLTQGNTVYHPVWRLGMGTEFGTFIGTDRIPPKVPSIDSREVNRCHISVPERTFTGVS